MQYIMKRSIFFYCDPREMVETRSDAGVPLAEKLPAAPARSHLLSPLSRSPYLHSFYLVTVLADRMWRVMKEKLII